MMIDERHIRQLDLVDENILSTPICIIGAGGIGSFTTLALAKIGFKRISVWDMDIVEEHNLANQFYPLEALGHPKVIALADVVRNWEGVEINGIHKEWKGDTLEGIVISAVDSMRVRKGIYNKIRRSVSVSYLIDGRMGANQLEIYTCNIRSNIDKNRYSKTLVRDEETANVPCTARAVMYNVLNIASWITNQTRLVLSNRDYKRQIIMDLENMILVLPEERVC